MGCTSSKPKRTKSIEDVNKGAELAKQTNGGVATTAAEKTTEVKSFLAPDGIPFIDEEVEEQRGAVEKKIQAAVENVKDTATTAIKDASNVVSQKAQEAITVVTNEASKVVSTDAPITASDEATVPIVDSVAEKAKEVVEGVINQVSDKAQDIIKVEDSQAAGGEEMEKAATKIQAMFRGYQTRKHTEPIKQDQ